MTFNLEGYACGMVSNVAQATYLLLVQKYVTADHSTAETMQLNSMNTFPLFAIYAVISGEFYEVFSLKTLSLQLVLMFLLVLAMGCMLNFALFWCTSLTSALTVSIVGGLKASIQTLIGLFTFGGVSTNVLTYLGIALNLSGSLLYIKVKYGEKVQEVTAHLTILKMHDNNNIGKAESSADNGTTECTVVIS